MFRGFKDFIMRGNVVDFAVGIVIGAAFTAVVTQLTESFFEPLIRLLGGGELAGKWRLNGVEFDWAAFINAVIAFLITALALYFFVVLPINRLAERRRRGEEPPPAAPTEEVKLLTEIRDVLVAAGGVPGQRGSALDRLLGRTEPPADR
jgi:large conductance mechanosensitive channel